MGYADESGNREYPVNKHEEIEWDVKKTRDYFKSCQDIYNSFLSMSDELMRKFEAFENDVTHTGPEADSSKAFVKECEVPLIEGITDDVQQLYALQDNLEAAFRSDVDSSDTAIVKTTHLKKIITDYIGYEASLKSKGEKIKELVKELRAECSAVGNYTEPEYQESYDAMKQMASEDNSESLVPKLKNDFQKFDENHKNDINGSDYKKLYSILADNIKKYMAGIGDGRFYDIRTYNDTREKLDWTDPEDKLTGAALEEYKQYIKDMEAYLRGEKLRCEVYKYDPVNMCNGNYINKHTDIELWGRYPIEFVRFYNAVSDTAGALGKGWSHSFEINIYEEDGKYRINYSDGSKGSFIKVGEVYLEEHGEPGTLEKTTDGYVIRQDDGAYQKFDRSGHLVALGDVDGDHTFFTYGQNDDGELRLIQVRNESGNELSFVYVEDGDYKGLIKKITDQSGRSVCYTYEGDRLVSVAEPDGAVRSFAYSADGRIKNVINPKGIIAITNEYDRQGRTIKQSFPDGSVMTYSYDDGKRTTTATEQNGNKVVYTHDKQGRHIKTVYYDGEERFTYNDKNQKTSATDKRGNTTRFAYDNRGHLTKVTDALGNKTCVTYRADGKPMAVKGAKGEEYKYSYGLDGKLFEIKNPLNEAERFYYHGGNLYKNKNAVGGVTIYDHDDRGNIRTITDPDGIAVNYKYDDLNRIVETITADGSKTTYEYDNANRLIRTTDALGNTREYTYDRMGKVISVKEPDGTIKSYKMDVMERISKVTDQLGNVTEISYNMMGKQEKVILPNGGTIRFEYDPLMRLTKVTDPEGRTIGYDYDNNGNVTAEYSGDIRERTYEYDALNRVTREKDARGYERTFEYDEDGQIISVTDTSGKRFIRDYDVLGRVIAETDSLGNRTKYTYTKLGDVATISDPIGRVRRFEYSKGGKLRAEYFCDKLVQQVSFDNVGRVEKRSFADGYEIIYRYDPLSRVSVVEGSDGRTVSYEYDAMGRATKVSDGKSTTLYTYTATGRLKSAVDPLGNESAYTYDALDNLKSVRRAEGRISDDEKAGASFPTVGMDGHVTLYSYDLSGQLSSITDALGQKEIYEYDQYGRLKSKKDRDDFVTSYDYNELGAVTRISYGDGRNVEFAYNELGQLREINDWLGKTTIENDALGRLIKVTDYQNRTIGYEYNAVGERTRLTYPDGRAAVYTYDEEGRLSEITSNGKDTRYSYDTIGRLAEKLLPNGVRQEYSYLPGGNLESMTSTDKEGRLDKYFYIYNSSGLISGINRKRRGLDAVSGQYDYSYDAIGRLTQTSHDGQVKSAYEYDAFGNRTALTENGKKTTYSYDVLDRLIEARELNNSQAIVKTYDYDKRGNQTKEFVDGLLKKTFTFDATNMLSKVVDTEKGEQENRYNGLGFRVATIRPGEKIDYLCDLSRDYYNLLERTVNGETENFIYDDNVISMTKAGNDYYYLQDELGSPMYMTGTDGVIVSSYAFDDFGRNVDPFTGKIKEAGHKHAYITDGNIVQPFAFTGYQEDELSGLKFAQARYYDAQAGRFQSEDNVKGFIESPFTLNHYGYCWGNPAGFVDNDGNWPKWMSNAGEKIKEGAKKAGKFLVDHKEEILATVATIAIVGVTVATCGAAAGAVALAGAAAGAVTGAVIAKNNGKDVTKGAFTGMAIGAGVGSIAAASYTAISGYMAMKAAEATAAGGAVYTANQYSSNFLQWLNRGADNNKVYFGIDRAGIARYVGITRQELERRLAQHIASGKPFQVLRGVYEGLTRNQARAIEQYFIEKGPNELNKINSISPNNPNYEEALKWAEYFIEHNPFCGD